MKKTKKTLLAFLPLLLATALPATAEAAPGDDPRLSFLKQLAGTWSGTFSEEMGEQTFEFRVTAGGHAVEEREMIGTPMEMLTVYYMEGSDLVGTHYCMLGNRPTVKAAAKVEKKTLAFDCNGIPGGARSHDEQHVHAWQMRLDDQGRVHYTAQLVADGEVVENVTTILTRVTEAAAR